MTKYLDTKAVIGHYDPQIGIGNIYKLLASWPTAVRTILFGWERTLEHPAQLCYAFDYTGKDLDTALKKSSFEAYRDLKLNKENAVVVDAGCGLGGTIQALGHAYPETKFIGISLSPGQVSIARERARRAGLTNASYIRGNYLHLPLGSGSIDGVIGKETFCYIADKDKARLFSELARVLKKGARISTFDAYLADRPLSSMNMASKHREIFRGWTLPDKISTADFVIKVAQKLGFRTAKDQIITERILGCSRAMAQRVKRFSFLRKLVPWLVKLRRHGLRLPLVRGIGLDDTRIIAFANTAELQYEMFACGDVQFREIVFEKF